MSVVSNSVALLNGGLKAAAGEEGTYRRASEAIERVVAVPARPAYDSYGDEPLSATAKHRDWIFWRADLVQAGNAWLPQRDDEWDVGGRTYIVLPRDGERCWRPTDPSEQQLRVFMQEKKPRQE